MVPAGNQEGEMRKGTYVVVVCWGNEIFYKVKDALAFQQRHEYVYGLPSYTAQFIKGKRVK